MIKFEITRFDAFEIDPIDADDNCIDDLEEGNEIAFWSVFGHLPEGGREALIDCRTEEQARELARHFELYLATKLASRA